jgi:uncharacterized membrane protein
MYTAGSTIPAVQFLLRWMTHICAPTFVFLAGLAMAFSIARKQTSGFSDGQINADLLIRGLFIMALDPIWMSLGFGGRTVFQVLYAIGGGLCCMALLRRFGTTALLIIGAAVMLCSEALAGLAIWAGGGQTAGPIGAFLATGGRLGQFGYVLYPLFPWLAFMIMGLGCGRLLRQGRIQDPARWFAGAGIALFALFLLIRGMNGYGNMLLYRDDLSLLQWLHVSKYPPSLSFSAMTLAMMCLGLALCFLIYTKGRNVSKDPLLVFGRVPLFFYLIHVHLLSGSAALLGTWQTGGLPETFVSTGAVLLVLYPLCRWYAKVKAARRETPLRYI